MLEVLTESGNTSETRARVANVLEEQKKTLRFAMSRPQVNFVKLMTKYEWIRRFLLQIQFVLYETHSELEAENETMVNKAIKEINRIAKLQHATILGKIAATSELESVVRSKIYSLY